MNTKLLFSGLLIIMLVSCSLFFPVDERELEVATGDGLTITTAYYIHPITDVVRYCPAEMNLTLEDNVGWFKADLQADETYRFETDGTGDPMLIIYSVDDYSTSLDLFNGEGEDSDNDSAADGSNALIRFTPTASGLYYMKIILYAGSTWKGSLEYTIP